MNRTLQRTHKLKIRATNDIDGIYFNPSTINNTLDLTVEVIIADPPVFLESQYSGGISISDPKGKTILVVSAENPFKTYYYILEDTIITHGENIEDYKSQMFEIVEETGELYSTTSIKSNMKGHFQFVVVAYNMTDHIHNDTVPVIVYIIGENNRVKFEFLNPASQIEANEIYVSTTSNQYSFIISFDSRKLLFVK